MSKPASDRRAHAAGGEEPNRAPTAAEQARPPVTLPSAAAPAQAAPVALDAARVMALQRSVGNAAVASVLARDGTKGAQSHGLETRLDAVSSRFRAHGTTILEASDACIADLQDCGGHMIKVGAIHKAAWTRFTNVLKSGDAEEESDQKIMDMVQGLAIAAVLGPLAPELIAIKQGARMASFFTRTAVNLSEEMFAGVSRVAYKAGANVLGEGFEIASGKGIDAIKGSGGKPSDTAHLAGPSDSEKFQQGLVQLDQMVQALPQLGAVGDQQKDLAIDAANLARKAAGMRDGGGGKNAAADLAEQVRHLEALEQEAQQLASFAQERRAGIASAKSQVLATKLETVIEVEDRMWRNWIARLEPGKDDVLDNDAIERYLHSKGMMYSGGWTSDKDERDTVHDAQKWLLEDRSLDAGKSGGVTESKFKAQLALTELKRDVVGRPGRVEHTPGFWPNHFVVVGKHRIPVSEAAEDLPEGAEVSVVSVRIPAYLEGEVRIEKWDDTSFEADVRVATRTEPP